MGTIKTKDQALAVGFSNSSKRKPKSNNSKLLEKKNNLGKPKSNYASLNPSKEKDKKGKKKAKFTYFHNGWNLETSCMKNTIDTMVQLLEMNNIPVPDSARKKDGNSSSNESKEKCHSLVVGTSNSSSFVIDSRDSKHMVANKYLFSSNSLNAGPIVRMGDDLELQTKRIGRIDL